MRKTQIKIITASCLAAFFLSACAGRQSEDPKLVTEISTPQSSLDSGLTSEPFTESPDPDSEADSPLPQYVYTGTDPVAAGICKYFVSQNADVLDGSVYIPVPVILKTSEEQGGEMSVYGVFWDFWYEPQGENLFCTRGGASTGRLRMRRGGSVLTVTEFEKVRDGGDFIIDLKQICGTDTALYDEFLTQETREDVREARRIELVAQYVKDNRLDFVSYQDYGWDPVTLTTEFHEVSPSPETQTEVEA